MAEKIGLQAIMETEEFKKGLDTYLNGLKRATGETETAAKSQTTFGQVMTTAVGTALGYLAATAIPALIGKLNDLAMAGINSAATFQQMTVMLESLTASELFRGGFADDMTKALEMAGPIAEHVLDILQEMSLTTPFSLEAITSTFRIMQAFGLGTQNALELTDAVLDLGAASNATNERMERIAYNFAQMALYGKITARDVRDLAFAGVDLASVLRGELQMSIEEVNSALADGSMTMQDVINAFTTYADKNFGGAAERMMRTLNGLKIGFQNLRMVASKDLFGPLVEVISEDLANAFDKIRSFVDSGILRELGEQIANIYVSLKEFASRAFEAFQGFIDAFVQTYSDTVSSAYEWGLDLMEQLATGIIEGIGNFIIGALDFLTSVLTAWLAPSSPPKVAPDIIKWGISAMEMYLRGFTLADFDVLEGIQGPLKRALQIATGLEWISEEAAGKLYAELSAQLAAALAGEGTLGADFFAKLKEAAGPYAEQLKALILLNLELAKANEAVEKAQKDLEKAQEQSRKARARVTKGIFEYNKMLKKGASDEELKAKLKQIQANQKAAKQATKAETDAEKRLALEEKRVALLQEQIRLQEALLQQLFGIAPKPPKEEPKKKGKIIDPTTPAGLGSGLTDILNQVQTNVAETMDKIMESIRSKLRELFGSVIETAANIGKAFTDKLLEVKLAFDKFVADNTAGISGLIENIKTIVGGVVEYWKGEWENLQTRIKEISDNIGDAWRGTGEKIEEFFVAAIEASRSVIDLFGIDAEDVTNALIWLSEVIMDNLYGALDIIEIAFVGLGEVVKGVLDYWTTFAEGITKAAEWAGTLKERFEGLSGTREIFIEIAEVIGEINTGFWEFLGSLGESLISTVSTLLSKIGPLIGDIIKKWADLDEIIDLVEDIKDDLVGHSIIPEMMEDMLDIFVEWLEDILYEFEDFKNDALEPFIDLADNIISEIEDAISEGLRAIKAKNDEFYNAAKSLVNALVDGIKENDHLLSAAIADMFKDIGVPPSAQEDFYEFGKIIDQQIADGITFYGYLVRNDAYTLLGSVVKKLNDEAYRAKAAGKAIVQAYADGMLENAEIAYDAARRIVEGVVDILAGSELATGVPLVGPPRAYQTAAAITNVSRAPVFNYGGVSIYSPMDLAVFDARVRTIIKQEMTP